MNLDDLRKDFKSKRRKFDNQNLIKKEISSDNRTLVSDMAMSSDISVAFIYNDYLYFCFGETGQKLKISMSIFKESSKDPHYIEQILTRIDSLQITSYRKKTDDDHIFNFCKSMPLELKSAKTCLLFFSNSVRSYKKALHIKEFYQDNIFTRVMAEEHIAALGAIALDSQIKGEEIIDYKFRNSCIHANIGEGVIELIENETMSEYAPPSIKDIIKGVVILLGINDGWIKDILLLSTTLFNTSFVILEKGNVRDMITPVHKDTTIPTRSYCNINIEQKQELVIEIEQRRVTSDISQYFSQISIIEIDANHDVWIKGTKDNQDTCIPLSTLIKSCPNL